MKRLTLFIVMALFTAASAHDPAEAHPAPAVPAPADTAVHAEIAPASHDSTAQEPDEADEVAIPEEPVPPKPEPALQPAAPIPATPAKQTIAVYMAGQEPKGAQGVHHILGGELARTISTSDKYLAVDRTDAILEQLSKEHIYQRSGAVDDDQIKSLGRQLGVQYLCISDINNVGWQSYYLDVRLVDVVSAQIIRTVTANSSLRTPAEMTRVARSIAYELIETEKAKEQHQRKKKTLLTTAISLDVIGLGAIAYGLIENGNMKTHIDSKEFSSAESSQSKRNAAYIAGALILASGVTIHIFF